MSKNENMKVENQAIEAPEVEVKPEGFFTKVGQWFGKNKKAIAITAVAGTALAFITGAIVKGVKDNDAEEYEVLDETDESDFAEAETDE